MTIGEQIKKYRDALESLRRVLGPSAPTCDGCAAEIEIALEIIDDALVTQ